MRIVMASAAFLLLAACSSSGSTTGEKRFPLETVPVNTSYRVLDRMEGTAQGFWLLGFIPIYNPSYADAEKDLLARADAKYSGTGGTIGVANVVEDKSFVYLILFGIPTKHVRADVVEFMNPTTATPPATYLPNGSSTSTNSH